MEYKTLHDFVASWPGPVKAIANVRHGDYAIGFAGALLCHSHRDMQQFRSATLGGHAVLCGADTADSINPGWASRLHTNSPLLPGRECWIVTRRFDQDGQVLNTNTNRPVWVEPSKDMVLWIIGGQSVYEQCLPLKCCSEVYLTRTFAKRQGEADSFFPGAELERSFVQTISLAKVYTTRAGNREQFELWRRNYNVQ